MIGQPKYGLMAFLVLFLLIPTRSINSQSSITDEPDTAIFIDQNFLLQSEYQAVHCVSGDNACPLEITISAPCLTATCFKENITYSITSFHETIQTAINEAQGGDLIIITAGRYAGIEVEETGGSDNAYIHILGLGDIGNVVIDRSADPDKGYLRHHFYFIDAHHFMIENLTFTNAQEGAGIFVSGYFSETGHFSHHFIVKNVYSHDNYSWGMHTTATSYLLVEDSVFTNSSDEHGLYVSGSGDHMVVRRNIFQGNNASGLQINADPQTATSELFYWLDNTSGDTCGFNEEDVDFTGRARWEDMKACYDSQSLPDFGEYIEDGISENIIIEQNIITGNGDAGGAGINLASIQSSVIRNNLIYGNSAAAIACWDNAYAEEKGLNTSEFGCHRLIINNNTMVDEEGNRGALIINNDATDIQVFNNIIIRDRFDAYEIANNSTGIVSDNNYYFAQNLDNTPPFTEGQNSSTGFSIDEGLSQFIDASFSPWIIAQDNGYIRNPDRPDFHLRTTSMLTDSANSAMTPEFDLEGIPHRNHLGALPAADQDNSNTPAETEVSSLDDSQLGLDGSIVYSAEGQVYLMRANEIISVSNHLDEISAGEDGVINISADGNWLLIETTRFVDDCADWSCWARISTDFTHTEIITINGESLHAQGFAAINTDGTVLIIETSDGSHVTDLYRVSRLGEGEWSDLELITENSPYPYNSLPAIADDGSSLLFDCGPQPYGQEGNAICEVDLDSLSVQIIIAPNGEQAYHQADYAPDGGIVFEGDLDGEQIWMLRPNSNEPELIGYQFNNDNSPCVLPSGDIVSLWLNRDGGDGLHEIKLMSPDGTSHTMLLIDVDVNDIGFGCSR